MTALADILGKFSTLVYIYFLFSYLQTFEFVIKLTYIKYSFKEGKNL